MPHQTFFKSALITRVDRAVEKAAADAANWKAVCQIVDARDKRECRACGKKSNPDGVGLLNRGHRHHIVYRSAGGQDVSANLVTLCATCHNAEHVKRTLRVDGDADERLTFWKADERGWHVWRQEIAVGIFAKD